MGVNRRDVIAFAAAGFTAWALPSRAADAKVRARALIITNTYSVSGGDLYLANTRGDGMLLEQRFNDLKFLSVDRVENAGEAELKLRLEKFRGVLSPRDVALVYIAGHGVQIADENFLLLGDGQTFLSILSIIDSVRQATSSLVVMLDACRNKPFEEVPDGMRLARAVGKKGTARSAGALEIKIGTLGGTPTAISTVKAFQIKGTGVKVVFATDPQNVALDAVDPSQRNSPFALAIAKRLAERKSLDDVVALATGDVVAATNGDQSPWSQGSIGQPIFLAGPPEKSNSARPPFQVPG